MIKEIFRRNKLMAYTGLIFLVLSLLQLFYLPFNEQVVLGLNSMVKPIKFSLSLWIYSWTVAYLFYYVDAKALVKWYSITATVAMIYEQAVISFQAVRGQLSHFNYTSWANALAYSLMGVMIGTITLFTLVVGLKLIFQKKYSIAAPYMLSIRLGVIIFVIGSSLGGIMSGYSSHNVGGHMGEGGLPLLDWSTKFGDLRIAHFLGIHSLQLLPLFGYWASKKYKERTAKLAVWGFSSIFFIIVIVLLMQALQGMALIKY